jgi:hypothetical protein
VPAPRLIYRCGPAVITLDPDGSLVAVVHDVRPTAPYLTGGGRPMVSVGGSRLRWPAPEVLLDSDEVEFTYECGPVRLVVRHSFAAGWGVRVALTNLTDEPLEIDDAGIGWVADPDAPAWALAAGASGAYAVPSPDGTGPLLGGVLALGACEWVTADAIGFSRLTVAPRGRFVVQWTWAWYRPGQGFGRSRHPEVPWSLYATVGERLDIVADEDTALNLPRGVVEERERAHSELSCCEPGRFTVELVSARGVTRYDLRAAQPYDEVITDAAIMAMNWPTSSAGIVRLADVHAALAVQQALLAGRLDDPYLAEDALDLFMARASDQPFGDAFLVCFACAESGRTGADEPLDAAARWLADQQVLTPGLGMAVSQASLMRVLSGFEVQPLIDWLIGLPEADVAGPIMAAMHLERITVSALRDQPGRNAERMASALVVGGWLGAGLKGRAVRPLSAADTAYLAAVFGLADEELTRRLGRGWGGTAHELMHRAEAQALFEITGRPAGPALSWLTLAARTSGG